MSDSKPRVLMMIDQFYPVVGGAEQQALRISIKLNEKGHKVLVLTRKGKEELTDSENLDGISINRLPVLGVSGKAKLKSIIPATRWLIKNKDNYDIIHCHGVNPLEWSAYLASFITKKPYVLKIPLSNFLNYAGAKKGVKMHSVERGQLLSKVIRPMMLPFLKFIRRRLISNANRVFAISPEILKSLNDNGYKNTASIPNGIDTDLYHPLNYTDKSTIRDKLKIPRESTMFVYTGRLSQEKNLITLLKAWKSFKQNEKKRSACLILLGGGKHQSYSCEPQLRNFTNEHKLDSVIFPGTVSNVVEYIQAADVFILPSLWEGMSNALLEAMACGLPSIVSDIPGNRALIEHNKSGLLFETTDENALFDCLNELAHDKEKRISMGQCAREIVLNKYSLKTIIENIIKEYENVLTGRAIK